MYEYINIYLYTCVNVCVYKYVNISIYYIYSGACLIPGHFSFYRPESIPELVIKVFEKCPPINNHKYDPFSAKNGFAMVFFAGVRFKTTEMFRFHEGKFLILKVDIHHIRALPGPPAPTVLRYFEGKIRGVLRVI